MVMKTAMLPIPISTVERMGTIQWTLYFTVHYPNIILALKIAKLGLGEGGTYAIDKQPNRN
jgi:hypothetical protein